ncbi:BTAD domain-containing putative transcriptional regulator [Nocardia sp. NPDC051052]|uniref:AfsR/SARP family transcriptional regulator n=1 Tax=Nocardia sp. NPDC051052 TaxID=3364322 RepID=UPI0037A8D819
MTNVHADLVEPGVPLPFCRILGSTEVEINGAAADLGGPRTRRVLTVLSTGHGDPVPDDYLIDKVWQKRQPGNVIQALRTIVNRLRTGLGPEVGHRYLRRGPGGYALAIPLDRTDHGRFAALIPRAQRRLADGESAGAADDFAAAVALWRGDPWQELGDEPELAGARFRLGELYETAVEELQAARLALGDTASAIAGLTLAVETAPYRERRWQLLALGLYRGGRQTEALAALHRIGRLLRTGTGTDPGPGLRMLEQRILHQDPVLLGRDCVAALAANRPFATPVSAGLAVNTGHGSGTGTAIRFDLPPRRMDARVSGASHSRNTHADNATRARDGGYTVDTCLVDIGNAADTVRRSLRDKQYDVVFIGATIQFGGDSRLLETVVNLAHELQPSCRFGFDDVAGMSAARRAMVGDSA